MDKEGSQSRIDITATVPLGSPAEAQRRSVLFSTEQNLYNRAPADLIEIELGSGGDLQSGPSGAKGGRSTYAASNWLQD